jgi:hypothetical protein
MLVYTTKRVVQFIKDYSTLPFSLHIAMVFQQLIVLDVAIQS